MNTTIPVIDEEIENLKSNLPKVTKFDVTPKHTIFPPYQAASHHWGMLMSPQSMYATLVLKEYNVEYVIYKGNK